MLQKGVSGFADPISGPPAREEQAALLEAALEAEYRNAERARKITDLLAAPPLDLL